MVLSQFPDAPTSILQPRYFQSHNQHKSELGNEIFEWPIKSSQEQYLHDYWWSILKTQLILNAHQQSMNDKAPFYQFRISIHMPTGNKFAL